MRKLALPLILVASLGASSAFAATTTTTAPATPAPMAAPTMTDGTIKALSAKACTVTLDNKTVYHFAAKCDLKAFKVGEKVTITWTAKGKIDEASAIVAKTA
jgi:diphthamide biosynthesis methyltransferase